MPRADDTGRGSAAAGTPVRLADGRQVIVRQIVASDREALRAMYAGVSDESRYRRFLSVHPELGESELTYLTEIDHEDHEALAAFTEDGEMVGIVRYVRLRDDEAEPAMLVHDDWQGVGIASELFDRLVVRAWDSGIRRFRAPVLAENPAGVHTLDRLGRAEHHLVGAEIDVEIELDEPSFESTREPRGPRRGGRPPLTLEGLLAGLRPVPPLAPPQNVVVVGAGSGGWGAATVTLDAAAGLARLKGASLVVVHAVHPGQDELPDPAIEAWAERLRANGIAVEIEVARSTPAAAVVDACRAHGAAYAVLGATRHRLAHRSGGLIGAVADVVARQAPCDVLLVRSRELPAA